MLKRMKEFQRYKDYYNLSNWEVRLALLATVLFTYISHSHIYLYDNLYDYVEIISDLMLCIVGAEFGLLGIILAGMAIIVGLISKEIYLVIKKTHTEIISRLMSQYAFCATNIVIQIVYLIVVVLLLNSNAKKITPLAFYICVFLIFYHLIFNILYLLALLDNCIRFIDIKNKIYELKEVEKNEIDIANEIRIDLLLTKVFEGIPKEDLIRQMDYIVDKSNIDDKDEIKKYLRRYYNV